MWFVILALIIAFYLIQFTVLPSFGTIGSNIIRPLMWISLALITLFFANKDGLNIWKFKKLRRWPIGSSPFHTGILMGGFQISLLIIVGLFAGFGKSPYSFTPTHIGLNLFFVASILLGTELSRAYLIKKGSKKRQQNLTLILVTLIFLFIQISPDRFGLFAFTDLALSLEFVGKTVITALSISLLASYLSYLGGATASIAYIGTLAIFEWFSPILPNPHWTISALVGTIAPAIGYIIIQTSSQTPKQIRKERRRKQSGGYGWTIAAIFCLLIVFFSFGYLGVKPTVIYSGSMQPSLDIGDIAIVEKIDSDELKEGDIIQYINQRNDTIMHRLVLIENIEGEKIFTTKGDANEFPDSPPIKDQRILGKSIFTIPKLGLVQIYVRNFLKSINIPIS